MRLSLVIPLLLFLSCHENAAPVSSTGQSDTAIAPQAVTTNPVATQVQTSTGPSKSFHIELHQRGMTYDENYVFTNDSIVGIAKLEDGKPSHDILIAKKTSGEDADKINRALELLNLDSLAGENKSKGADGKTRYTFSLLKSSGDKNGANGKSIELLYDALTVFIRKQKQSVPGNTYILITVIAD